MEFPVVDFSAYLSRHRDAYLDGLLRVSQRGVWPEWLAFLCQGLDVQGRDALRRAQRLLALRDDYRRTLGAETRSPRIESFIDHLLEHTAVTIRHASELLGVSYPTAQGPIQRLERRGVLDEATGKRRDRVYRAREVLAVLDDRRLSTDR